MTRTVRQLVIVLATLLAAIAAWRWYIDHPTLWPKYRQAKEIVAEIEQFKASHGRLPTSLTEINGQSQSEADPIYYQPFNETDYVVWFGRSLGESYTYDSQSGAWQ